MDIGLVQASLSLASGLLVGFSLGLIGGGGSILAVPLLIYVVGVRDTHVAIATSAAAVAAWSAHEGGFYAPLPSLVMQAAEPVAIA